jgi:aspartate/methionine/tyrosine aminotransferase
MRSEANAGGGVSVRTSGAPSGRPAPVRPPTRMDAVQSPVVAVVGELIRQTPGAISLGQGIVHYGPPPESIDAVREALSDPGGAGLHEYQPGAGVPVLLEEIARKLAAENGIDAGRGSRVMVTAGANMAFIHAVLATTAPGDEVILPVPFYFNHEMAVDMAGCRAVKVPTDACHQPDIGALARAITPRTRVIVTVSPNNPSGAVYTEAALRAIGVLCQERGIYHVSDEAYEYFTYGDARHVSPASLPGAAAHTISIYSLSKAYGFAGWRIGYVAYPEHLDEAMGKSQDTILICPPVASQLAAAAALRTGRGYCAPHVRNLARVRDAVVSALSGLGSLAEIAPADGALYCMLRVRTEQDPMTIVERLIRDHGVAVIPGGAFGLTDGCCFRVAYGALREETVAEGVGRLVRGLRALVA